MMMRQIHFASTDLALHSSYPADGTSNIYALEKSIAAGTMVMQSLEEDRFLCGFGHIFAGGRRPHTHTRNPLSPKM
jgi:oligopeptidase A